MTPKEVGALIAKSRDVQVVEIDKDLKPTVQAQRLREFTAQVQKEMRKGNCLLVAVTV